MQFELKLYLLLGSITAVYSVDLILQQGPDVVAVSSYPDIGMNPARDLLPAEVLEILSKTSQQVSGMY